MKKLNNKTAAILRLPILGTYIPVLGSPYHPWPRRPLIGKRSMAALCLLLYSAFALADVDQHRYQALTKEIRCVVCQNQSIADSDAPLANDLRKKVYAMVQENKSDNEIKNYLVARYGEFILLKPRFNALTFMLWLFPFTSLLVALWLMYRHRLSGAR